ncbi:MAG TPA: cation diffusion facilitator family transporter [Terriglobales bacterium]|nr:cation diffusion facilitator family transporter [Terriglobales bacterium]
MFSIVAQSSRNCSERPHELGLAWKLPTSDNAAMSGTPAVFSSESMRAEKRAVAGNSVLAAIAITTLKIVVGISTGSLGILSEAAHSGLDLIAALVTFFSIRVSDKPADADHQYGHGKVENFSAFIETGLLLLTCVWIVYEAVLRLFYRHVEIEPSLAAFAVMFLSMTVDYWRSRALGRIAAKYDSQALEADALHFSTDIWSSAVVVLGLLLVMVGRTYKVERLRDADPVAALFVAGVVVYVSWRLARKTVDALLDAAPSGVRSKIIDAVSQVAGVLEVDRVRIRRAGNRYFADLSIGLARNVTFQRSEQMADAVTASVHGILPDADVVVHSIPRALHGENIFDRIRAVATRHNFNVHDVSVQDLGGRLHVEQHLELDERLSLLEAHDRVTLLESEIRRDVPEISSILTHIESEPATIETGDEVVRDRSLERRLKAVVAEFPDIVDMHDVQFKRVRDRLYVSCHCTMSDDLPLSRVHDIQTALEIRFKQDAPELFRVLIHPEPQTDNRR